MTKTSTSMLVFLGVTRAAGAVQARPQPSTLALGLDSED